MKTLFDVLFVSAFYVLMSWIVSHEFNCSWLGTLFIIYTLDRLLAWNKS